MAGGESPRTGLPSTAISYSNPYSPPLRHSTPLHHPGPPSLAPSPAATTNRAPFSLVGPGRSVSMATQRFGLCREGQRLQPVYMDSVLDYELASDQQLASSQPVSLIELCRTNIPRNRTARNSKLLLLDRVDNMIDIGRDANLLEANTDERSSRAPFLQHLSTGEYGSSHGTGHLTPPPRTITREYPWQSYDVNGEAVQEQAMPAGLGDHTQKNPLNYTACYNLSQQRESSSFSESPFLRNAESKFPVREAWFKEQNPASRRALLDTPRTSVYAQKAHSQREYIPVPSLQLYRASFDRPHDKSPYETFRVKHRHHRTDLPEITSGLQYGYDPESDYAQYAGNTTVRSEPTFSAHYRERLPNFETITQLRGPAQKLPDLPTLESRISSGTSIAQQNLKEQIYAMLDNMTTGTNADSEQVSKSHDSEMIKKEPAPAEDQLPTSNTAATEPLMTELQDRTRKDSASPKIVSRGEASENPDEIAAIEQAEARTTDIAEDKEIRPPPGLFDTNEMRKAKSTLPQSQNVAKSRLEEANAWFHTDNRGEGQLRQHISTIADNFVERNERVTGQTFSAEDRTTTKQTITLLGDALANLHAYGARDHRDHDRYFADFKPVRPHHCKSSHGPCRSYWEYLTPWSRRTEKSTLADDRDIE
ncbi:hypothetical protein BJX61DRAFT_389570 [Aspergillus egyptiacus]|nr:hypothetical protein BJX61DRAFT_389570 [Aspergillus egyptiacus]